MVCIRCGHDNGDNNVICEKCGFDLTQQAQYSPEQIQKIRKVLKWLPLIFIVFFLILGLLTKGHFSITIY